jgi:glutamyl-tRNA reductase
MDLLLVGASHRTTPLDVRGRLAGAAAALAGRHPVSVDELLVLSTCHRVEVVAVARDARAAERELRCALTGMDADADGLYVRAGRSAILHLGRVAAGLDSLIIGEAEISGQIRRAVAAGRESGLVGPILERVTAGVLRASGRARSETRVGQGTVSAATAAVSLLERAWGSLDRRTVLVVGAGEAGRQALGRLRKRRAGRLLVASRSSHHATEAAGRTAAEVVALERIASVLADVDGVIVATRAPGFLIDADDCRVRASAGRILEIVDLSVPRLVDPAASGVVGVRLQTVDDLGDVVRESVRRREREVPAVERIVADEAERTYRQFIDRRDRRDAAVA